MRIPGGWKERDIKRVPVQPKIQTQKMLGGRTLSDGLDAGLAFAGCAFEPLATITLPRLKIARAHVRTCGQMVSVVRSDGLVKPCRPLCNTARRTESGYKQKVPVQGASHTP